MEGVISSRGFFPHPREKANSIAGSDPSVIPMSCRAGRHIPLR